MKTAFVLLLIVLACRPAAAQSGRDLSLFNFRVNAQGINEMDMWLKGRTVTNVAANVVRVNDFTMESFRDGKQNEVQFIAEAPECFLISANNNTVAWDSGHIKLFTPTTNMSIEGDGFYFTESSRVLFLSNNVQTYVLNSAIKSPVFGGGKSNAPANRSQTIDIFARRCLLDNLSNRLDYAGAVHAVDVQMDLHADFMTVQLATNGGVKNIHAWDNVVIYPTNRGQATGSEAFYYLSNDVAMIELKGNAVWTNGVEEARASRFIYDITNHFLIASNQVAVQWPKGTNAGAPLQELNADYATLQLLPTNNTVDRMEARGQVVISNQADQSLSGGDRALYVRTNDMFKMTGHAWWQTEKMSVQGETLTAEISNKLYHARGQAHLRLKVNSATKTNQWMDTTSDTLDYQTNLAVFRRDVHALLLDSNFVREALDCDVLHVTLVSNQIETATAQGHVLGKTAPDAKGGIKIISCQTAIAHRSPQSGLMKNVRAEGDAVLMDIGPAPKGPTNSLRADIVTAFFAPDTNRLEEAIAENHVVIDHFSTSQTVHATGDHADYTLANDRARLTGRPIARIDSYLMIDADYIDYRPKTNQYDAGGPFQLIPLETNRVSAKR